MPVRGFQADRAPAAVVRRGRIDHSVAGRNVFQINVREAGETAS